MKFLKDKKVHSIKRKILESNHIIDKFKQVREILEEARKS
jgi:hypothetical protein